MSKTDIDCQFKDVCTGECFDIPPCSCLECKTECTWENDDCPKFDEDECDCPGCTAQRMLQISEVKER